MAVREQSKVEQVEDLTLIEVRTNEKRRTVIKT